MDRVQYCSHQSPTATPSKIGLIKLNINYRVIFIWLSNDNLEVFLPQLATAISPDAEEPEAQNPADSTPVSWVWLPPVCTCCIGGCQFQNVPTPTE